MEKIEVVVFQLAEFEEVEACFGPFLDKEIDRDITNCSFNNDRHG